MPVGPVARTARSITRTAATPDERDPEQPRLRVRPRAAPNTTATTSETVPRTMYRYGSASSGRRLRTSVFTPTSPSPRPASRAGEHGSDEHECPAFVGAVFSRVGKARHARIMTDASRGRDGLRTRPALPEWATLPGYEATRRNCERGQGDDAPARRERGRGDDRQVAQAARRHGREVRAAARGHHRQGQRRGAVAVRRAS